MWLKVPKRVIEKRGKEVRWAKWGFPRRQRSRCRGWWGNLWEGSGWGSSAVTHGYRLPSYNNNLKTLNRDPLCYVDIPSSSWTKLLFPCTEASNERPWRGSSSPPYCFYYGRQPPVCQVKEKILIMMKKKAQNLFWNHGLGPPNDP